MIASRVDFRDDLPPVRQQGRRQTCLAFATSTAHEQRRGSPDALSVEYLFFHAVARTHGANPDAGTSMDAAAAALAFDGQPIESVWPYQSTQLYVPAWSPPLVQGGVHRGQMTVGRLLFADLCAALDAKRTVVLGLIITDAFRDADSGGMLPTRSLDPERGAHAVLAVGHGAGAAGTHYLLIRNSWGPRWAHNGHAWLSENYIERQLHETAIIV